jgi:hypothetical protein
MEKTHSLTVVQSGAEAHIRKKLTEEIRTELVADQIAEQKVSWRGLVCVLV